MYFLKNFPRMFAGAALIFGGAFGWVSNAAADSPTPAGPPPSGTIWPGQYGSHRAGAYLAQWAKVSCSLPSPNFNIVIGNLAKVKPITFAVSVDCQVGNRDSIYALMPGWKQAYCYHIHGQATVANGSDRFTSNGPAQAANPAKGIPYIAPRALHFRLYANDYGVLGGQRVTIGSISGGFYNITGYLSNVVPYVDYAFTSMVTLEFDEYNDTSQPYPPGAYPYTGAGLHWTMMQIDPTYGFESDYSNTCQTSQGIGGDPQHVDNSFGFTFTVKTYCSMDASKIQNIDFGTHPSLSQALKQTGRINVDCSAGTDYKLTINHGRNYDGSSDYMKRVSDSDSDDTDSKIRYIIDYPADCPNGVCTGTGSGLPAGIDYNIDAEVPRQPTPPDGKYRDTIVITLDRTSPY